jgi:hypothetical protein
MAYPSSSLLPTDSGAIILSLSTGVSEFSSPQKPYLVVNVRAYAKSRSLLRPLLKHPPKPTLSDQRIELASLPFKLTTGVNAGTTTVRQKEPCDFLGSSARLIYAFPFTGSVNRKHAPPPGLFSARICPP